MNNSILPLIPSILNVYESEETACAAKKDKESTEDSAKEKDLEGLVEKYAAATGPAKEEGCH